MDEQAINEQVGGHESLEEVLAAYLEAQDAGRAPRPDELRSRYPHLADELDVFFAGQDRLSRLAAPLREAAWSASAGGAPTNVADVTVAEWTETQTDAPTESFGDYEVLGEIARGGMGVVYRARQVSLNRPVALKVIRAGHLACEADIQRFRNEAETAALLDHPHIVPVYEVGCHAGRLFFSMKLIEGGSVAGQLDRFKEDPKAAARLLATVARAVHHAHQRGVLHRDLKPSNILLDHAADGQPVPHVTDFGLAKRMETDSGLTQSGCIVGTPAYMPPEQAEGKRGAVTVAADVYGLGAILYAMLTGRPPFQGATVLETLERVVSREPDDPSGNNPSLDRDLRTICLKCLEKDPARRYGSAEELARDLECWLNGEPIQARSVTRAARLWSWCRRNPAVASLSFGLAAALVLGVAGLTVGMLQIWSEQRRTHEALVKADADRQAAERAQRRTRAALDAMSSQVIDGWLAKQTVLTADQRKFLEQALTQYEEFAADVGEDAATRAGAAGASRRVGDIRRRLGQLAEAEAALTNSVAGYRRLTEEFPAARDYAWELAFSYNNLAAVLRARGRPHDAEARQRDAQQIFERLTREFPTVTTYQAALATSHRALGQALAALGKKQDAETEYRAALAVHARLAHDAPKARLHQRDLADAHNTLGGVLKTMGNWPGAEAEFREALVILSRLVREEPADADDRAALAYVHTNLGLLLDGLNRPDQAEAEYREALRLQRALVRDFPAVPNYSQQLANTHNSLSVLLQHAGKYGDAEAQSRQGLVLVARLARDFPDVPGYQEALSQAHHNLASALLQLAERPQAAAEYRRGRACLARLARDFPDVPEYGRQLAQIDNSLGLLLRELGKFEDAETCVREALTLSAKLADQFPRVPDYRRALAEVHSNLGNLLLTRGRRAAAEEEHRQAVRLCERLVRELPGVPGERQDLGGAHMNLANVLAELHRPREAEAEYRRALAVLEPLAREFPKVPGYRWPVAGIHGNLGNMLAGLGRGSEAEGEYRLAVKVLDGMSHDWPHEARYPLQLGSVHYALGRLVARLGRPREAEAEYRETVAVLRRLSGDFPAVPDYRRRLAQARRGLAVFLANHGEPDGAVAELREALTVFQELAKAFPGAVEYAQDTGACCSTLGQVLSRHGRTAEALDSYARAVAALSPLVGKDAHRAVARQYLSDAYRGRAEALGRARRDTEAVRDWDQAINLDAGPGRDGLRLGRASALAAVPGRQAEAVADALAVVKSDKTPAPLLYDAACDCARAAGAAGTRSKPDELYAAQAMALLRRAVARGWREARHTAQDPDLNALHGRADFQKLLADLHERQQSATAKPTPADRSGPSK
jgi:tetratricopeptide (TPR) repeat protein